METNLLEKSGCPDLSLIHPSQGEKYSPNLYSWLRAHKYRDRLSVYKDEKETLWIGAIDNQYGDGQWFHGCKLISVLCNGKKEESMAYAVTAHFTSFCEVRGFWGLYLAHGRCAIDPGHTMYFIGDSGRIKTLPEGRFCSWCSKHL